MTQKDHEVKYLIAELLYHLGADITLVATVNSWNEEQTAESTYDTLKSYSEGKPMKIICSVFPPKDMN